MTSEHPFGRKRFAQLGKKCCPVQMMSKAAKINPTLPRREQCSPCIQTLLILVISCGDVPTYPNATPSSQDNHHGAVITYTCDEGFQAEGEDSFTATCLDTEQWNISTTEDNGCQSKCWTRNTGKMFHQLDQFFVPGIWCLQNISVSLPFTLCRGEMSHSTGHSKQRSQQNLRGGIFLSICHRLRV